MNRQARWRGRPLGPRREVLDCRDCGLYRLCQLARLDEGTSPNGLEQRTLRPGEALPTPRPVTVAAVRSGAFKRLRLSASGEGAITGFWLPGEARAVRADPQDGFWVALGVTRVCRLGASSLTASAARGATSTSGLLAEVLDLEANASRRLIWAWRGPVRRRVAAFLWDLRERQVLTRGDPRILHPPMARSEIASYLDLNLSTVSRSLSRLEADGVLRRRAKALEILDADALERLALEETAD